MDALTPWLNLPSSGKFARHGEMLRQDAASFGVGFSPSFIGDEFVGYYPAALFQNGDLDTNCNQITAGGWVQGPGALPPMGSGGFSSGGFGRAAFMNNVQVLGSSPSGPDLVNDANLQAFAPAPQCYDVAISNSSSGGWRTYIYYGGPGGC